MNKRFYTNDKTLIGQLADQAHEWSYKEYSRRLENERADQVYFFDIFNQKFTELLIEKSAELIALDTSNYPGVGAMSYYQGVSDAVRCLNKHFRTTNE